MHQEQGGGINVYRVRATVMPMTSKNSAGLKTTSSKLGNQHCLVFVSSTRAPESQLRSGYLKALPRKPL